MKTTGVFYIALLLMVGLFFNGSLAEDYTRSQLPAGAKMRLGKGSVNDLAFSRDGAQFAVATTIGIWMYEARTGEAIVLLTGHKRPVKAVAFSLDGRSLTSADASGETRLWDATTGELRSVLTAATDLVDRGMVVLSSDGTRLATGNIGRTVRLWHLGGSAQKPIVMNMEGSVNALALSPDGRILANSNMPYHPYHSETPPVENFRLQVWDTSTQNMLFSLTGDAPQIYALAFSPDGKTLVGLNTDESAQLWDVGTGNSRFIIKGKGDEMSPQTLAFSADSKHIAISDVDGKVGLWDITKAAQSAPRQEFRVDDESVHAVAFSPDGKTLLTASESGTLRVWDTTTGNQRFTITEHIGPMLCLTFSETDGALTSINSPEIWLASPFQRQQWDIRTGDRLSTVFLALDYPSEISPDGSTVLTDRPDGALDLWDTHTKRIRSRLKADQKDMSGRYIVFSLDGKMLAYIGDDRAIYMWKNNQSAWRRFFAGLPLGRSLFASDPHFKFKRRKTESTGALTFSADGKILAHTGTLLRTVNTIIQLYSTETGETLSTFKVFTERLDALVFSPDEKKLAGGNQETIYLWDASTGAQLAVCTPERLGPKRTLVFSPDSRILISAVGGTVVEFPVGTVRSRSGGWITGATSIYGGGTIQLWDASTGALLSTHEGHTDHVQTLAFSKDEKTLATGSADGTILLWDWETLKKVNIR